MKVKNVKLLGLNGQPLRAGTQPDAEVITTARALLNAALAAPADLTTPRDPKEVMERYEFAQRMQNVELDESFELDFDFYQKIRHDLMRVFNTIASAQVLIQVEKQ